MKETKIAVSILEKAVAGAIDTLAALIPLCLAARVLSMALNGTIAAMGLR